MSAQVSILDSTLRDGAADPAVSFSGRERLEIASTLDAAGVAVLEIATPAHSEQEFRVAEELSLCVRDSALCCLSRSLPDEIERSAAALRKAAQPVLHIYIDAARTRRAHRGKAAEREVNDEIACAVKQARRLVSRVEFSPVAALEAEPNVLASLARAAFEAGSHTFNLSDTVGRATAADVARGFAAVTPVAREFPGTVLSFHGHNDSGRAVDNAVHAVACGARQVEVTLSGIGPRGGNTDFAAFLTSLEATGRGCGVERGAVETLADQIASVTRITRSKERRYGFSDSRDR